MERPCCLLIIKRINQESDTNSTDNIQAPARICSHNNKNQECRTFNQDSEMWSISPCKRQIKQRKSFRLPHKQLGREKRERENRNKLKRPCRLSRLPTLARTVSFSFFSVRFCFGFPISLSFSLSILSFIPLNPKP